MDTRNDSRPLIGRVTDAPEFTIEHPAAAILGEPTDQHMMCAECGAIGRHTARCSANAKPVGHDRSHRAYDADYCPLCGTAAVIR